LKSALGVEKLVFPFKKPPQEKPAKIGLWFVLSLGRGIPSETRSPYGWPPKERRPPLRKGM